MQHKPGIERFINAQNKIWPAPLEEIKNGRKRSHWMWYVFPQISGLGNSETSRFYALADLGEAELFFNHPILGSRLVELCDALLNLKPTSALEVFGSPDNLKLHSCLTLFAELPQTNPIFEKVIKKFFLGKKDRKTLELISEK